MRCDLAYVKAYADRHGRMRYYFRKKGRRSVALPGAPGSPEFLEAYQQALAAPKPMPAPPGVVAGSFDALCRQYMASAEFKELAPTTQKEAGYVIEKLRLEHGPKPVKRLERKHILGWKAALKDKPGAANKMLRTLKVMLAFAVLAEYRPDNPAEKIRLMKLGRFRAWKDEELAQFEGKWPIGTPERMIFDLALYSGQRRSDVCVAKRSDVYGPDIHFVQRKTGVKRIIRVHAHLKASMDAFLPTHNADTIIAGPAGTALSPVYMSAIFRDAAREAGLPKDCVLHGLRKTTARILAELQMRSTPITGHRTRAMQDEYERDASDQRMAKAAVIKWEKRTKKKRA